jgi:hypothetical protein
MRTSKCIAFLVVVSILLISCQQEEKPVDNNDSPNRTNPDYAYIAGVPAPNLNKIYRANPQNGSGTTVAITESYTVKTVGINENLYEIYYTYQTGSGIEIKKSGGLGVPLLDSWGSAFDPEEIEWCNGNIYGIKASDLTLYYIAISGSGATATPFPNAMFGGIIQRANKKTLCKQGTTLQIITGNSSGGTSLTLYTLNTATGVASGATTLTGGVGFSYSSTANLNSYYAGSTLYVSIFDGGTHSLWTLSGSTLVATPSPGAFGILGTDCSWMPGCCS